MSRISSTSWRYLAALGAMALVLGACGSTSVVVVSGTPTVKAPTATATKPAPTPTQTVAPGVITACFGPDAAGLHVTQVGDLLFAPVTLAGLTYPSAMLPDGTPLSQPFKMAHTNIPGAGGAGGYVDFPSSPLTNPVLANTGSKGGGLSLSVCNVSGSARHILQHVSVRIDAFNAYGGQLNQWNWCDGSIDSHHNPTASGCGGAVAGCVCFDATFPAGAGVGATATATQTDGSLNNPGDGLAHFPYVVAPGKAISFQVTLTAPTAPGRYVFTIGVSYDDGSSPVYAPTPAPEVLLAPVAHKWDGMTCLNTPSLLAQITATAPETYYICAK